jgi:hypothetical protein
VRLPQSLALSTASTITEQDEIGCDPFGLVLCHYSRVVLEYCSVQLTRFLTRYPLHFHIPFSPPLVIIDLYLSTDVVLFPSSPGHAKTPFRGSSPPLWTPLGFRQPFIGTKRLKPHASPRGDMSKYLREIASYLIRKPRRYLLSPFLFYFSLCTSIAEPSQQAVLRRRPEVWLLHVGFPFFTPLRVLPLETARATRLRYTA